MKWQPLLLHDRKLSTQKGLFFFNNNYISQAKQYHFPTFTVEKLSS